MTKSFSYDYTTNGLKKSFTMPDGTAYEYTYGDNNELREIRLPGTGAISYPSYTWTRPDAVQYPGGGRREYSYDPLMRITRITANDPGKNLVLDSSYTYDSMDNILSKQIGQETYNYTYDALYRLTDVQVDIPGLENESFSYDMVGNRLSEDGVEGEWNYNDNNELLTFANSEYHYDANGNAIQLLLDGMVMFTYHYNAQDRLVQVDDVNGSTIAEYVYDPFGRRLWKDVGGTRTYFFYADEGLVAEYDAGGTEIRTYGYRPDSTWTTDPLWLKQGNGYYFYQNDHLGTPQKLVKMNGAIAWSASYTAFGKASVGVETVVNNLRFPGQYYDAETGLHYNFHRYYASGIGRYLRTDPVGADGGINLYTYGHNSPIDLIDALGLISSSVYFTTPPLPLSHYINRKKGEKCCTTPWECTNNCTGKVPGMNILTHSLPGTSLTLLSLNVVAKFIGMPIIATYTNYAAVAVAIYYGGSFLVCSALCGNDPCRFPNPTPSDEPPLIPLPPPSPPSAIASPPHIKFSKNCSNGKRVVVTVPENMSAERVQSALNTLCGMVN